MRFSCNGSDIQEKCLLRCKHGSLYCLHIFTVGINLDDFLAFLFDIKLGKSLFSRPTSIVGKISILNFTHIYFSKLLISFVNYTYENKSVKLIFY